MEKVTRVYPFCTTGLVTHTGIALAACTVATPLAYSLPPYAVTPATPMTAEATAATMVAVAAVAPAAAAPATAADDAKPPVAAAAELATLVPALIAIP